jgi:D-alanyl-D-alanine carboxypeptidase (penicillin-binding protein 5/6)
MASCTKIMTAMLLIEHCPLNDVIVGPPGIDKVGESSMHLKPGEKVSVEDMLYALMLRSANDGAVAVAVHVAGSVPQFVAMMNARALQIGCTHTHFDNPNGLNDTNHFTSAHDLALIAREAMRLPEFRKVVSTWKHQIVRSINTKDTWMISRNKWLKSDPSADGIKTGYTVPAGHCYVGSATRNGWRVITVLLNSGHWQEDHKNLLDWAFSRYSRQEVVTPGEFVGRDAVVGGVARVLGLAAAQPIFMPIRKGEPMPTVVVTQGQVKAPVRAGQVVGQYAVRDADGFEEPFNVMAVAGVAVPPPVPFGNPFRGFGIGMGVVVVGGAVLVVRARRSNRRMRSYGRQTSRGSF